MADNIVALYEIFKQHPVVSTDTRKITPGAIFFALHGDNFDGNRFAADALEKGASFAVIDNSAVAGENDRFIVVNDTLIALQQLARHHRMALGIPILAITGTNGKTTTKELVSRILAHRYRVAVTQGNLNNHIGVPLTLLAMRRGVEFGVVEMGASACGEIALLCDITHPDSGLITNIGKAHLEGFGGEDGVKKGKGELFDYLNEHFGLAFYCRDDETIRGMISERHNMLAKGYSVCEYEDNEQGVIIKHRGESIKSHLVGDYNRFNISAAIAIGEYYGITPSEIKETIEEYAPDNNRSQRVDTSRNTLILDCYNANPSSMVAALTNFGNEKSDRVKLAILGDMLELGDFSAAEHAAILRFAATEDLSHIYLVGKNFTDAANALNGEIPAGRISAYPSRIELAQHLKTIPQSNSLILIKGSRGIGLERITEIL